MKDLLEGATVCDKHLPGMSPCAFGVAAVHNRVQTMDHGLCH